MNIKPDIDLFLKIASNAKHYALDAETTGLDWKRDKVVGVSIYDGTTGVYIPTNHTGGNNIMDSKAFYKHLANVLKKTKAHIAGHNIKFDMHMLANDGVILKNKKINNTVLDTMLIESTIDEHRRFYSLEAVSKSYNITPKEPDKLYKHLANKFGCNPNKKSMGHFHKLPGNDPLGVEYAIGDTVTTYELLGKQLLEIERQDLQTVFDLEMNLIPVLVDMERRGVKVDEELLDDTIKAITKEIWNNKKKLGLTFNSKSPKQIDQFLDKHGIYERAYTAKGNMTFDKNFLSQYDPGNEVLRLRQLQNFLPTFLLPLKDKHLFNGRVHPNFNQLHIEDYGTVTGRLSSNNPNMQQVPKHNKEIGQLMRQLFIADKGMKLYEADYNQQEFRLFACYSGDPILINGYNKNPPLDAHEMTAHMLGSPRQVAKTINFAILYYAGAAKIAQQLKCSQDLAWKYKNKWKLSFPKASRFGEKAMEVAKQNGYVRTILGRKRRFTDAKYAYRAGNAIIQGSAADIMKSALIRLYEDNFELLLTIHDSVIFQAKDDDCLGAASAVMIHVNELVKREMKTPFPVDIKSGKNWAEATYGE